MAKNKPIGAFDSGVGGTSIWKEFHQLLPNENTIYLADSKNAPYGNRTKEEIILLSSKNTQKLIELGCKIIVVACNTATTNAISELRKNFDIPIIGIEPAIKPAALMSQSGSIGVLATKGTLSSDLFASTSKDYLKNINVVEVQGIGLVPLIEKGELTGEKIEDLLKKYLNPMIEAKVDHVVLGCSHYPYLIPTLEKLLPEHIQIIDSGKAVARQIKKILEEKDLLNEDNLTPSLKFYTNSDPATLYLLLEEYKHRISIEEMEF